MASPHARIEVEEAGDKGRRWHELQRKFRRIRARELKDIGESLVSEDSVTVTLVPPQGRGRPDKIIRAA